jgi:hypothetical protein
MMYNVRRASADPLLDYARVDSQVPLHSRGEHLRVTELVGTSARSGAGMEMARPARK